MDPYLITKWIHILSSTVLFGTGIGTAFQMVWAFRGGNPQVIHSVARGVVMADWLFTTPAGTIQPLSGLVLIWLQGYGLFEPWLVATYALYLLAFSCWLPVVRLQIRIRDLTRNATQDDDAVMTTVRHLYARWFLLGWPAFTGLVGVFWLMVSRPDFGF